MTNVIINIWIYILPLTLVIWLITVFKKSLKPNRVSMFASVKFYYDQQKEQFRDYYNKSDMKENFEEAGLSVSVIQYRVVRDGLFVVILAIINLRFLIVNHLGSYPFIKVIFVIILYISAQLRPKFPIVLILKGFQKGFHRKKNSEVLLLQQLISNEYADANSSKQNVYHLLLHLRRYTKHIQPAIDSFLKIYPLNPEEAFRTFSEKIGTPEAEALKQVLEQIDESSSQEVREILQKRYEELKKKRQQNYKSMMTDRGILGYVITFSGVLMVILCCLYVYYLEYQDLMSAAYNYQ